jgi:hypothetical protein
MSIAVTGPLRGFNTHTKGTPMSGLKSTQVRAPARWDSETFCKAARLTYPTSTAWYVARASGQSVRTVEKHLRGEAKPGANAMIAYLLAPQLGVFLMEALHLNEGTAPDQDSAGD